MRVFNKKDLRLKSLRENLNGFIVNKKQIKLREDNNNEQDAYVEKEDPSQNLSSALSQERATDPNATNFVTNLSDFDGNANTSPVTLDVKASNPNEAQRNINTKLNSNPQLRTMANSGNLMANIHMENVNRLRTNSVSFSKREINEMISK